MPGLSALLNKSGVLTSVRSHSHVSVRTSSETRIDTGTKSGLPFFAIAATTISDIEGHHDSVPFLQQSHSRTDFLDYAHILVTCWQA